MISEINRPCMQNFAADTGRIAGSERPRILRLLYAKSVACI